MLTIKTPNKVKSCMIINKTGNKPGNKIKNPHFYEGILFYRK